MSLQAKLSIREFAPGDIPQILALQQAYQQVFQNAAVIPGEVYLSESFENGKNIFCAFDETGRLQGYAPLFPQLTGDPQIPDTVWAEVKTHPGLDEPRQVKDCLFDLIVRRVNEISRPLAGRRTRLTFQYYPSETLSIDYVISRGCVYTESVFRMRCDLVQIPPDVPPLVHIDVRRWRMEEETEQVRYIQARNEVFPEAPVTLKDWQYFLSSPAWANGTTLTAFDGREIVGSVAAYWDEGTSQQIGQKAGFTEYIFVREKWRGRGIGAYLIYQGLVYLREQGREASFLEVKAANQNALDLYHRLGYRVIDESRLYVLEV